jgi:hypothetical protein
VTVATATDRLTLRLLGPCNVPGCVEFASPLHQQLSSGYEHCSTLTIPDTIGEWTSAHRTARKRSARARRLGYVGMGLRDRGAYADDIYEINVSAPERQGRPMSPGYHARPSSAPDSTPLCPLHGVHAYGVFAPDGPLVAYLWMYRAGDLALVSSILGHAEHLANDIMYELFHTALCAEVAVGAGVVVYNRNDSGTDGLRYFKSKLGFVGSDVEWLL